MYDNSTITKKIIYIANCEYTFFFNKPNVVGVGLGYKITNGFNTNKKCIKIFVSKKVSLKYLHYADLIPKTYKEITTDVEETGIITSCSFRSKLRPALGGYSIGPINEPLGGTLGCIVSDGTNFYILSNNHIFIDKGTPINTPITQPNPIYGGKYPDDVIANLSKYVPLKYKTRIRSPENHTDCAIAKITNSNLVSYKIALLGNIDGTKPPTLNKLVRKVGETSELTLGHITSINVTTEATYSATQKALFKNQIATTRMSEDGDSGSVLLDFNNYAIGLLFSSSGSNYFYNPIDTVLSSLGVSIV